MKRPLLFAITAGVIILGGFVYAFRTPIRDWWDLQNAPVLPIAIHKVPQQSNSDTTLNLQDASPVEGGMATSQNFVLVSNPPKSKPAPLDPMEIKQGLPDEINLDVPFTTQAPTQNWDMPFQEACEEVSAIMVDAYYRGQTGILSKTEVEKSIKDIVEYEIKTVGHYEDTSSSEMKQWITGYFGYEDVRAIPIRNAEDIQRVVANGYPALILVDGKKLANPNFRNGGPLYHVLVVKGYSKGRFITNDPGTRKGKDYTYTFDQILNAAHDWTGKKADGPAVMVIVMPKMK
ncbi:C39 family peptidase [Candidatus Uhrbacteria bacterium]|nr:C39 family peptidase [Candidatus Uhrbacteria bacterium]